MTPPLIVDMVEGVGIRRRQYLGCPMTLAILILIALPLVAQDSRAYGWSLAALGASQVVDIHSSMGMYEQNPVLGRGPCCTAKQVGVKVGIVTGVQVAAWYFTRRHPKARRLLANVNFGAAALTTGVAIHNYSLRRGQ